MQLTVDVETSENMKLSLLPWSLAWRGSLEATGVSDSGDNHDQNSIVGLYTFPIEFFFLSLIILSFNLSVTFSPIAFAEKVHYQSSKTELYEESSSLYTSHSCKSQQTCPCKIVLGPVSYLIVNCQEPLSCQDMHFDLKVRWSSPVHKA